MTKADLKFIEYVKNKCKQHDIKCDLRNTKYVKLSASAKCAGYFDETNRSLVVSMNRKDSLSIIVHEFGHFTQWIDSVKGKCDIWEKAYDSLYKLHIWLEGKNVKNIEYHIGVCRDLELDNEKRSVKLCKKHNLSIDVKDYTRRANAYVHFYNWLFYSRKWSTPKNSPYKNKTILEAMSDKFNMRYDVMSTKVHNAFKMSGI